MTPGKARACRSPTGAKTAPKATPTKAFAVAIELDRRRMAKQSAIDQVVALRKLVFQLHEGQKDLNAQQEAREVEQKN